jgi:hypothetical protein
MDAIYKVQCITTIFELEFYSVQENYHLLWVYSASESEKCIGASLTLLLLPLPCFEKIWFLYMDIIIIVWSESVKFGPKLLPLPCFEKNPNFVHGYQCMKWICKFWSETLVFLCCTNKP